MFKTWAFYLLVLYFYDVNPKNRIEGDICQRLSDISSVNEEISVNCLCIRLKCDSV